MRGKTGNAIVAMVMVCPALAAAQPFEPTQGCDPYMVQVKSPRRRIAVDAGVGWQDSDAPVSGLATSLGFGLDWRLGNRLLVGARASWLRGRDAGVDADGDGRDDDNTGGISSLLLTAGPRVRLLNDRARPTSFWELDVGIGGMAATGAGDSGAVAEAGLSLGNDVARLGARYVQGALDAADHRAALAWFALGFGGGPQYSYGAGCDFVRSDPSTSIPFAIGIHAILSGWGLADELGYLVPGLAIEVPYYLRYPVDAVARWDFQVYPAGDRDAEVHQSGLLGARVAIPIAGEQSTQHLLAQVQLGYSLVTGTEPRDIESGPIVDAGAGYALLTAREGLFARVHARFGIGGDNRDLAAIYVTVGGEMKNAARRWYRHAGGAHD